MKHFLTFSVCAALVGATSSAFAWWQPSYWRCTADQFPASHPSTMTVSQRLAFGRTWWAKDAYNATGNLKYWDPALDNDVTTAATTYNTDIYPTYMDMASPNLATWVGPGPNATGALWGNSFSTIRSRDRNLKPATVEVAGLCEPGCYAPDQEVRFGAELVPIAEAYEKDRRDVVTLAPNASFDGLNFITNEVARYTVDIQAADQEILAFRMKSGGEIKVTTEHPLLTPDGTLRKAKELVEGDSLVREDGAPDPIASIEHRTVFTKVYNLRPVTTDLTSNILVAQGYLNGSARYQNEYVNYLNRVLLRRKIPTDLIPRSDGVARKGAVRPEVSASSARLSRKP